MKTASLLTKGKTGKVKEVQKEINQVLKLPITDISINYYYSVLNYLLEAIVSILRIKAYKPYKPYGSCYTSISQMRKLKHRLH